MKKAKYDLATVFFLGIILVSIAGSLFQASKVIIWLLVGICGAMVAIQNIKIKEEKLFLIGTTALLVVMTALLVIPEFRYELSSVSTLLMNLMVGFGVAGFIVALGLISRLGLEK
ncbi:MAG: hypothetical protein V1678_05515 [Candidatus Aenigmatarchaeota archaeon]